MKVNITYKDGKVEINEDVINVYMNRGYLIFIYENNDEYGNAYIPLKAIRKYEVSDLQYRKSMKSFFRKSGENLYRIRVLRVLVQSI